jgi:hypothetical protein
MLDKNQVLERIAQSPDGRDSIFYDAMIGDLDFRGHVFDRAVNFSGAVFSGDVDFSDAVFTQPVSFNSSVFHKQAFFRTARFERGANFAQCNFKKVDFFQSRFYGTAYFWRTFFYGKTDFSQITVSRAEWLPPGHAGQANFSWARFHDIAVFTYAEFEWPVYFYRTLFMGDTMMDQCRFDTDVMFSGKQNEVLFPRFGRIDPDTVRRLEEEGLFRPDTECHRTYRNERVSEFVCFNNILSRDDLGETLERLSGQLSTEEAGIILTEWEAGARKMFADNRLVTFRGAQFRDLEKFSFSYADTDNVVMDRAVAGPPEFRARFEARLKSDWSDVFISHASEDKECLARPLASKLREMGYVVWLDESQLEVGDDLVRSLDAGMQQARFGIVALSKAYLEKKWTRYEVEQLLDMSRRSGKKLFFLWHGVDEDQVRAWSPELAGKTALITERFSIDAMAGKLARAMR